MQRVHRVQGDGDQQVAGAGERRAAAGLGEGAEGTAGFLQQFVRNVEPQQRTGRPAGERPRDIAAQQQVAVAQQPVQPALHGPGRDTEPGGDIGVAEPSVVAQRDDQVAFPVAVRRGLRAVRFRQGAAQGPLLALVEHPEAPLRSRTEVTGDQVGTDADDALVPGQAGEQVVGHRREVRSEGDREQIVGAGDMLNGEQVGLTGQLGRHLRGAARLAVDLDEGPARPVQEAGPQRGCHPGQPVALEALPPAGQRHRVQPEHRSQLAPGSAGRGLQCVGQQQVVLVQLSGPRHLGIDAHPTSL